MVPELELQDYQVKVAYLAFMNQYFICVQLINSMKKCFGRNYTAILLEMFYIQAE